MTGVGNRVTMQSKISIVCVYNDQVQFESMCSSALRFGLSQIEIIGLDNRESRWESAAAAYNEGVKRSSAPYILFSHQDIVFTDSIFFADFIRELEEDDTQIIGVAGAKLTKGKTNRAMLSGMYQGSKLWRHHTIASKARVETLDECLFGCHKDIFKKLHFDENACDGWHFYAVDFCLQAGLKGVPSFVIPANVLHLSGGNRDASYYLSQEKIKKKYSEVFDVFATTCGWSRTEDIDPYRPIVEDELNALIESNISYGINFYRPMEEVFSLDNTYFLPSSCFLESAKDCHYCKQDAHLSQTLKNDNYRIGYDILVAVNNFIAGKEWLLNDLLDLKADYIKSANEELATSPEYRPRREMNAKAILSSVVANANASSANHEVDKEVAFDGDVQTLNEQLEGAFHSGTKQFVTFLDSIDRYLVSNSYVAGEMTEWARLLLAESSSNLSRIFNLKRANDQIDEIADCVRSLYVKLFRYRILNCIKKVARRK